MYPTIERKGGHDELGRSHHYTTLGGRLTGWPSITYHHHHHTKKTAMRQTKIYRPCMRKLAGLQSGGRIARITLGLSGGWTDRHVAER